MVSLGRDLGSNAESMDVKHGQVEDYSVQPGAQPRLLNQERNVSGATESEDQTDGVV
jgi:hypothetical protein